MADFTPQEIEQFLQQFFDTVGARQYVGARYVPIFGRAGEDTVEWDDLAPYEPLTVVMHEGVSYVSRRYVPNGIQITDTAYWVETYRFNAQVEQYRQEVLRFESDKVPFPDGVNLPKYGTDGQVLGTLGDGSTEWLDPVVVTSEIAGPLIDAWLDEHPEATTTVADNSITTAKIRDGQVTDPKLAQYGGVRANIEGFYWTLGRIRHPTDNVVRELAFHQGKYFNDSNAEITANTWGYTDLIPCTPGVTYYTNLSANTYINFYAANETFISGFVERQATAPSNAAFIRISASYAIQPGIILTAGGPYRNEFTSFVQSTKGTFGRITHPADNVVTELLFNQGRFYNETDAQVIASGWGYTDLIPCTPGETYYTNLSANTYINFYDSSQTFISGFVERQATAPSNAAFIRISASYANQSLIVLTRDTRYRSKFDYRVDNNGLIRAGAEDITVDGYTHRNVTPVTYDPQTAIRLKVGTFNIGHFNYGSSDYFGIPTADYDRLLHNWRCFLAKQQYDLLNINEYVPYVDYLPRADALSGSRRTVDYVLKPQFSHFDSTMAADRKDAVLASRYPISNPAEYTLQGIAGKATGYCKYHQVTIDADHVIGMYGLQMPYHSSPEQMETSSESIANRLAILGSLSGVLSQHSDDYVILAGDMNTPAAEDHANVVSFCASNGLVPCNGGYLDWLRTYDGYHYALDNVLVSSNIQICNFESHIDWSWALSTDHYAVSADIVLG